MIEETESLHVEKQIEFDFGDTVDEIMNTAQVVQV